MQDLDSKMSNLPCNQCGAIINLSTVEHTGGLCRPCFRQIRAFAAALEKAMKEAEAEPSTSLSLERYVALLDGVPMPTQQQKENFVDYVSDAHSWYKHLPLYHPGWPFYFFLDKYAGCDLVAGKDGGAVMVERTEQGFHYSAIPTEEYRTDLGHLAYSCDGPGRTMVLAGRGPLVVPRDKVAAVQDHTQMSGLPAEILEAGVVLCTGLIHACSLGMPELWADRYGNSVFWRTALRQKFRMGWPEGSGGQRIEEKIQERCRQVRDRPLCDGMTRREAVQLEKLRKHPDIAECVQVDPVLYELLEPERRRQQTQMLKAIDRVCELVESRRKGQLG